MKRIFIDMDGTVADFYQESDCLERMTEEGFFRNLRPMAFAQDLQGMANVGLVDAKDMYILSACVDTTYCRDEKREWIAEYLPFIKEENILLMNVGENKAEYVEYMLGRDLTKEDILFDDYTKNLNEWEWAGGLGVKALNGINGKSGNWQGRTVKVD